MTPEELDRFLRDERTCRVATVGGDGSPHASPLWFVWDGRALWLTSVVRSQRWANVIRDPRVSVVMAPRVTLMAASLAEWPAANALMAGSPSMT